MPLLLESVSVERDCLRFVNVLVDGVIYVLVVCTGHVLVCEVYLCTCHILYKCTC